MVTPVNRHRGVVCSTVAARSLGELDVIPEPVITVAPGEELLEFATEATGGGATAMLVISAGPEEEREVSRSRGVTPVRGVDARLAR